MNGANPVISLSHFLAHLVDNQTLALNGVGRMMQFMAWGWGTTVFGEKQPDLLEAHDQIFEQGNGTTYALTQVQTNPQTVTLEMDIRYALGHHSVAWDGKTEGQLPGHSIFPEVFNELVNRFQQERPGAAITVATVTVDAPDVRDPQALSSNGSAPTREWWARRWQPLPSAAAATQATWNWWPPAHCSASDSGLRQFPRPERGRTDRRPAAQRAHPLPNHARRNCGQNDQIALRMHVPDAVAMDGGAVLPGQLQPVQHGISNTVFDPADGPQTVALDEHRYDVQENRAWGAQCFKERALVCCKCGDRWCSASVFQRRCAF